VAQPRESGKGWLIGIHVSHLSREKQEFSGRALESALLVRSGSAAAYVCLSADGFCIHAGPDIHLLPQAVASFAQPVICGTWQSAHRVILMFFPS